MPETTRPARWKRWSSGSYRLHLSTGAVIDFTGRLRLKEDDEAIVDYDADSSTLVMFPHFTSLLAIENLPQPIA